jgi:hypothetical protein
VAELTRHEEAVLAAFRRVFGDDLANTAKERTLAARSSAIGSVESERLERERRAAERRRQAEQGQEDQWWNK